MGEPVARLLGMGRGLFRGDDRLQRSIRPVHDRMPVLLMPDEYDAWLHDDLDSAIVFQERCFPDALIDDPHQRIMGVAEAGFEGTKRYRDAAVAAAEPAEASAPSRTIRS